MINSLLGYKYVIIDSEIQPNLKKLADVSLGQTVYRIYNWIKSERDNSSSENVAE